MLKRLVSFALAVWLSGFASIPAFANSKDTAQLQRAEKVRAGINKIGVGRDAQVSLKLINKVELTGYISETGTESFVITDPKSSESKTVRYAEVTQLKGNNLTTKAKVAIWVGVSAGIVLLLWLIKTQVDDCC